MAAERLQKILAKAGIASRRGAEDLISEGLVTINGKVAQLGDKAIWGKDAVKVKGKLLQYGTATHEPLYFALYKPKGMISALVDPQGRPTIKDLIKGIRTRVFPVGRLDFNSEGLLLLTNDGDAAEKIQKDEDLVRVYEVKVKGHPEQRDLAKLAKGVAVGEFRKKLLRPASVKLKEELDHKSWIEVTVEGGGAFDVKELFMTAGFLVERVVRTAIGSLSIKGLTPGQIRPIKAIHLKALLQKDGSAES